MGFTFTCEGEPLNFLITKYDVFNEVGGDQNLQVTGARVGRKKGEERRSRLKEE